MGQAQSVLLLFGETQRGLAGDGIVTAARDGICVLSPHSFPPE